MIVVHNIEKETTPVSPVGPTLPGLPGAPFSPFSPGSPLKVYKEPLSHFPWISVYNGHCCRTFESRNQDLNNAGLFCQLLCTYGASGQ